jgi:hypothetical protein
MGMYDYLGTDGEQVKCFYVPIFQVDEQTGKSSFGSSGGMLKGYNKEVPFKTFYYNYGKNFIVFDYQLRLYDYPIVHVIQNGEYFGTFEYDKVPDDITFDKAIDEYGDELNIRTIDDILWFIETWDDMRTTQEILEAKYCKKAGVPLKIPSFKEFNMSPEKHLEYMRLRKNIQTRVQKKTSIPFHAKWYESDSEVPYMLGGILCLSKASPFNEYSLKDSDISILCRDAIEYLREKGIDNPIDEYIEWAKENDIELTENEIREFFEEHLKC